MNGFRHLLRFELRRNLLSFRLPLYLTGIGALSILAIHLNIVQTGFVDKAFVNAPLIAAKYVTLFSNFGVFLVGPAVTLSLLREKRHGFHTLYYSLPLRSRSLYWGRFWGSWFYLLLLFSAVLLAVLLAPLFPWSDPGSFTTPDPAGFAAAGVFYLAPNLFFCCALFHYLAARTGSPVSGYLGAVILFVVQLALTILADSPAWQLPVAYLDPLGVEATEYVTRYWTLAEKNVELIPFAGPLAINRLVWTGAGVLLLLLGERQFRLTLHSASTRRSGTEKGEAPRSRPRPDAGRHPGATRMLFRFHGGPIPSVRPDFGPTTYVRRALHTGLSDLIKILRSPFFWVLLAGGFFFLYIDQWFADRVRGVLTRPGTLRMVEVDRFGYVLYAYAVILYYTVEVAGRERTTGFAAIADALPVPAGERFLRKYLTLSGVSLILTLAIALSGVVIQILKGYYRFEPGLYASELLFIVFPDFILFQTLALFLVVLAGSGRLGFVLVPAVWGIIQALPALGVEHPLFIFSELPPYRYSDLNGYGHFVNGIFWMTVYWLLFAGLLATLTGLIWREGSESGPGARVRLLRRRLSPLPIILLAGFPALWMLTGFHIGKISMTGETYITEKERNTRLAEYERRYRSHAGLPQPKIDSAFVAVDLYPEARRVRFRGKYRLVNRHPEAISELHVVFRETRWTTSFELEGREARITNDDRDTGHRIYRLAPPLAPGDSLFMHFGIDRRLTGFSGNSMRTEIVSNGSLVPQSYLPRIGYQPGREIDDPALRRRLGLPVRVPILPGDPAASDRSFAAADADWISMETVVSTSGDQTALAPGDLAEQWSDGNRNYFRYRTEYPTLFALSWVSGQYEVRRSTWKSPAGDSVRIAVFHHPGHRYNIGRMMEGARRALEYHTSQFGPYPHGDLQIVEIPRFVQGAFALPATIPFSESFGFTLDVERSGLDLPLHITAHEVAHQWWGYRLVGADAAGARFLGESLSQYAALQVLEKTYGRETMQRFLDNERSRYLLGRSGDASEPPLTRVGGEAYVHSAKGSLVMHALEELMGEERLNNALRSMLEQYGYRDAPYPTSDELYAAILEQAPARHHRRIRELLREVVIYRLGILEAEVTSLPGNRFRVTANLEALKQPNDRPGSESPLTGPVPVVLLDSKGDIIYYGYEEIPDGVMELTVDKPPFEMELDPYHTLIETNRADNRYRLDHDD